MGVSIADYYVCQRCRKVVAIESGGKTKKYCPECAKEVHKEQIRKSNEQS